MGKKIGKDAGRNGMVNSERNHGERQETGIYIHGRQGEDSNQVCMRECEYKEGNRKDGGRRQVEVGQGRRREE